MFLLVIGACRSAPSPATEAPNIEPVIASATDDVDDAPGDASPAVSPRCDALPEWRYETFLLPPEFAPTLPEGTEVLWFAPGMFEPDAADYFTYAFSMDMKAPLADAAAIESLLREYYRGLMRAVAAGRDTTPARDVTVSMADDGQTATIEMSDEFTGGGAVTVHLRLSWAEGEPGRCLRILASARPSERNWEALERSLGCLCEGTLTHGAASSSTRTARP